MGALDGKVAIVAAASKRIERRVARLCAAEGGRIVAVACGRDHCYVNLKRIV